MIADYKNADISAHVPGLFKQASCIVEVFCDSDSWLLKNKSWDRWHRTSNTSESQYVHELRELVARRRFDWIILTDDYAIRIMNDGLQHDDSIAQKILPLSRLDCRDILGSKAGLSVLSKQAGIITPAYEIYNGVDDPLPLARRISFPLILKVDRSGGGKGVFFCADEEALLRILTTLPAEKKRNLVFQRYIVGDNVAVEALYKNGIVIAYATSTVLKNVGSEFSVAMLRHYHTCPGLMENLNSIGRAFGINGFSSMTFMRSTVDGQYYFVEADLRPHAWFYLAKFAGIDFSAAIRRFFSDSDDVVSPLTNTIDLVIPHFSRQLRWLVKQRNFIGIAAWFFDKNYRTFIPLHDWKLLRAIFIDVTKSSLYDWAPLRPIMRLLSDGQRTVKFFLSRRSIKS